jgi:hypothetical protein
MVRPGGLEPPARGLGNRCSIHLSYGRIFDKPLIYLYLSYITYLSIIAYFTYKINFLGIQKMTDSRHIT